MNKLVVVPLVFLMFASLLSVMGLSDASFSATGDFYSLAEFDGYYDENGNAKAYPNGTAVNEHGNLVFAGGERPYWSNSSGNYEVYRLKAGDNIDEYVTSQFNMGNTFGLIAIVVGLMALATVAGLRVLGTGTSETSVKTIVLGTGFLSLWGVFSILGMNIITSIPVFGALLYFFLTGLFTVGVMQSIGGAE